MIAVVQRVSQASVIVDENVVGEIGPGLLLLASVEKDDTQDDVEWTAAKIVSLRIFRNGDKHFDQDVKQVGGAVLLVSNFTVAAETRTGRRPSLSFAASPDKGRELFDLFVQSVRNQGVPVATGRFGADMRVSLVNDGPATFIVKSSPPQTP